MIPCGKLNPLKLAYQPHLFQSQKIDLDFDEILVPRQCDHKRSLCHKMEKNREEGEETDVIVIELSLTFVSQKNRPLKLNCGSSAL